MTVPNRHTCTECGERYTTYYGDGLCSDCAADLADAQAERKLDRPLNWADMGSSERDLWEERHNTTIGKSA